jgi:hypothetical protein
MESLQHDSFGIGTLGNVKTYYYLSLGQAVMETIFKLQKQKTT